MAFCSNSGFGRLVDTDVIYTGPSITCGGSTVNPGDTVREFISVVFLCANDIVVNVDGNTLPIPDGTGNKVAFVGSGTYTQSGGSDIVVPSGHMGILNWDGGEWSLSQSVEMPTQNTDGEIEEGDDSAVSGDTVFKYLDDNRGLENNFGSDDWILNTRVNPFNGTISAGQNYAVTPFVRLFKGDKVSMEVYTTTPNSREYFGAIYDSNKIYVGYDVISSVTSTGVGDKVTYEFEAVEDCYIVAYTRVVDGNEDFNLTVDRANDYSSKKFVTPDDMPPRDEPGGFISYENLVSNTNPEPTVFGSEYFEGGVINTDGTFSKPNEHSALTGFIRVSEGDEITTKFYGTGSNKLYTSIAFYDKDKNFIGFSTGTVSPDISDLLSETQTVFQNGFIVVRTNIDRNNDNHLVSVSIERLNNSLFLGLDYQNVLGEVARVDTYSKEHFIKGTGLHLQSGVVRFTTGDLNTKATTRFIPLKKGDTMVAYVYGSEGSSNTYFGCIYDSDLNYKGLDTNSRQPSQGVDTLLRFDYTAEDDEFVRVITDTSGGHQDYRVEIHVKYRKKFLDESDVSKEVVSVRNFNSFVHKPLQRVFDSAIAQNNFWVEKWAHSSIAGTDANCLGFIYLSYGFSETTDGEVSTNINNRLSIVNVVDPTDKKIIDAFTKGREFSNGFTMSQSGKTGEGWFYFDSDNIENFVMLCAADNANDSLGLRVMHLFIDRNEQDFVDDDIKDCTIEYKGVVEPMLYSNLQEILRDAYGNSSLIISNAQLATPLGYVKHEGWSYTAFAFSEAGGVTSYAPIMLVRTLNGVDYQFVAVNTVATPATYPETALGLDNGVITFCTRKSVGYDIYRYDLNAGGFVGDPVFLDSLTDPSRPFIINYKGVNLLLVTDQNYGYSVQGRQVPRSGIAIYEIDKADGTLRFIKGFTNKNAMHYYSIVEDVNGDYYIYYSTNRKKPPLHPVSQNRTTIDMCRFEDILGY